MKLYDELAAWWPLFSPPEDYAEEAAFYLEALEGAADRGDGTLLELGCGGGNNASHMKTRYRLTLVDPSPGMLAHSRALNPECEHMEGDMRTLRLGREFDRVFVHDAVCYMTTEAELRAAMETAFVHCRPGGAALFAPDAVKERFRPSTDHGGADGEGRAVRFLEWSHDPDPEDSTCTVDYVVVLRDERGEVRVEHDRHLEGLFSTECWLRLLAEVGFEPRSLPFRHSEVEDELTVFVARRATKPPPAP